MNFSCGFRAVLALVSGHSSAESAALSAATMRRVSIASAVKT